MKPSAKRKAKVFVRRVRGDAPEQSPANTKRASRARAALRTYSRAVGNGDEDSETQLSDLLCDLMHLADAKQVEWAEVVSRAENHYSAESLGRCRQCEARYDPEESDAGDNLCPRCNQPEKVGG